ncbi:hypothetical protein RZS28_03820 [Methylocapsa polymorpha]|uniref:Uncharacterized protein n=1 Tax=Methylocapsa polymorpha TaxID=3080828 RepID=A0ABZ0HTA1_9HYPH|nr:hypothetical protein RZS28_03820 [Methylocapsa sp. RX1]
MTFDERTLLDMLPAVYRTRDQGGDLSALLSVVADQLALLEEDLAQLYDDQFIETCADWAVPYIGSLIGHRQLHGVTPQISSPRAEVANTLALRRGKGTAATLELLAWDVTGWEALVVEQFERLAITSYLNHLNPGASTFAKVRGAQRGERPGGPFDRNLRFVEIRNPTRRAEAANIANVTIALWRLRTNFLSSSPAARIDVSRYLFNPLGAPIELFSAAAPKDDAALSLDARNFSQPFERWALAAAKDQFYGADKSFFIEGVTLDALAVCDLSDMGAAWAHTPPAGKVAVDPKLGRIAFGTPPATTPKVSFHSGAVGEMGGGSYDRVATFATLSPVVVTPTQRATIQAALTAAAGGGAVEIADNGVYAETLSVNVSTAGASLEIRSADKLRPMLSLGGELTIAGADGSQVSLNGLLIAGKSVHVQATPNNRLNALALRHCTLPPGLSLTGAGAPTQPLAPSLVIETGVTLQIDNCILGGLRVAPGARVTITNSIIDATSPSGVAYAGLDGVSAGGALTVSNTTIVGKVHTNEFTEASNVIFFARLDAGDPWVAPIIAERRQTGSVRFSYVPPRARVPRPYQCQPAPAADPTSIQPVFVSLNYGDAAYGQLSRRTPREIREGSEDGSEMGAFRLLYQPQRETNLRLRLDEYLRFGLEAGVAYAT